MDGISGFWELADVIGGGEPDKAATRTGTVSRIDADGTAYVRFPGADIDMPVCLSVVDVKPGDMVNVRIENGRASIPGNVSSPSVGVQRMQAVEELAQDTAEESARTAQAVVNAQQTADEAQKVAEATNQHFFADTNGAHITDVTQDEWAEAVDDNFSDYDPTTKPYHNQLLNSLGILLRTALNNLVSITRSAIAFYDGAGNAASNIVARFGSDGAQIGKIDESHVELDYHSLQMVDKEGGTYFHVSDLRGANGRISITETITLSLSSSVISVSYNVYSVETTSVTVDGVAAQIDAVTGKYIRMANWVSANSIVNVTYETADNEFKAYTLGLRGSGNIGAFSVAEGRNVLASGHYSHVEGNGTTASGNYSHAEGKDTTASGLHSHSQNLYTRATGSFSHAEGDDTTASGTGAHAEGVSTVASSNHSHAEGGHSVASGRYSHAQNYYTLASSDNQTAIGKYNVEDTNDEYALIIGNGIADNARSNALAVKWDGTVETAQDIPWTELTLASGWTAYSTARTPMYRRVGSMVEIRGAVKPTAETSLGTSSVTFGNLPQGCRPVNMEVTAICQGSGVKEWLLTVDTDGNVGASRMRTMNSTAYQSAGTSEFMIFDASFLAG